MSGDPLVNYEFNRLLGGQSCQECKNKNDTKCLIIENFEVHDG